MCLFTCPIFSNAPPSRYQTVVSIHWIDTLDHQLQEEEEDVAPQLALAVTLHQVVTGEFEIIKKSSKNR